MHSNVYNLMVQQMDAGAYTEINAKITIDNFYGRQQITHKEYEDLMDRANELDANTRDDEINIRLVNLENDVETLKKQVKAILNDTEIKDPTESEIKPDGSAMSPIMAYRGMTYYKDKYYRDSEDNQIYLCTRDNDTEPGEGVALNYLPHELVNTYFNFYSVR